MIRKFILIFFLSNLTAYSQNCNNIFSGKVIDFHDGSPLIGAIIVSNDSDILIQTDLDGNFSISNLCEKTYEFKVSHPSCISMKYKIKIKGNKRKNLRLEHHIEELNEVSIYGESNDEDSKTLLENKISAETIDDYSNSTLGDLLNNLSGISSYNTGNTIVKPIINGLHSSRVLVINNGVKMEDQDWGAEHAPNIDINSIENLKLIKGAGLLEYSGSALGGIIITEPLKIDVKDSIYGKTILSGSTNGKGSTVSSKLTKTYSNGWYASSHISYKYYGDFKTADYILSNTGTREKNGSFRIGFNKFSYGLELYYSKFNNQTGILRASHAHSAQDIIRAINSSIPLVINDFTYNIKAPKQKFSHSLIKLKGFKWYNDIGKLSFQYDFQKNRRFEYDIRRGSDKYKPSTDLKLRTHSIKFDFLSSLNNNLKLKTGISGRYQNNFPDPNTGIRRIIPDYDKFDLAIYATMDYSLNKEFILEAGGRFDYTYMDVFKYYKTSLWNSRGYNFLFDDLIVNELTNQILINSKRNFKNFSATIGMSYDFKNNNKILFNYTLASRIPNPAELYSEGLHHSSARIEVGDLRFNSELGHKLTFSYMQNNKKFKFLLNPFVNFAKDFILIEPSKIEQTIRGIFQVWEYKQTDAQLSGIDFDLTYFLNEYFSFKNQTSLIKGYDLKENEPLINLPPVNTKNEIVYNNLKLNNLKLKLQSEYVFRQNEYPNNNFEVFIPISETFELLNISEPPKAYHILNLNSSIDFSFFNNSKLNLTFKINNVFNISYRNYLNRLRYFSHDLGRNFIINLKLNY
ncbi:MAG: TonB-dependent receptor [Flavobacteriaceae bacterium]|tara:strand:- start:4242 stop:6641 length:2400 start_codon:yes stop_codon:yes gene_type:complete